MKKLTEVVMFAEMVLMTVTSASAADSPRWTIARGGEAIAWDVASDARLPHADFLEMSGRRVSLIFNYDVAANRVLSLKRTVIWPSIRVQPNDTHGSLTQEFGVGNVPALLVDGKPLVETVRTIEFDGVWTAFSDTGGGLGVTRRVFPSDRLASAFEEIVVTNAGTRTVEVGPARERAVTYRLCCNGRYAVGASVRPAKAVRLPPGAAVTFAVRFSAVRQGESEPEAEVAAERAGRLRRVRELTEKCVLETGDPVLDTAFRFAKIRVGESIFETAGGLMHSPGGGPYYAGTWCNDELEYAGPWFGFAGDDTGLEASLNAYLHYMPFMAPDYEPIPSSVIAEGRDYWNGRRDRGDAAMWASGATRFLLASGRRDWAERLLPGLRWTLEYCRRNVNGDGVLASDTDEMEGRLPSGTANLNTSSLYYDALKNATVIFCSLGDGRMADACEQRAARLAQAIEVYFGVELHGYRTYRYYRECEVLRSWIGTPLCFGLYDRAEGTADALLSPYLWIGDGMLSAEGEKTRTTWDRSLLYAFRGIFAAGYGDRAIEHLRKYSSSRLIGEHVPYPIEAWPEGNRRHLSAEGALYCRLFTEGVFGLRPTGFDTFEVRPRLPKGWKGMALRNVHAFKKVFDVEVDASGQPKVVPRISQVSTSIGEK